MDAQYWAVAWFYGSEPEPGPDIPQFRVTEEECCCKEEVPVTIHDVVHVRSWWSAFLTDCRQVLAKVPVFDNLPLQGFLRKASVEAAKCPRCGPVALEEISDFLPWVKERISYQLDHEVPVPVGSIWGRSPCDRSFQFPNYTIPHPTC